MENKIFLERMRSKRSNDTSGGLNVELKGNRKLLPLNDVSNVISLMEQYSEEREECNIVRLTCQVNPVCSNVLFNRISEIVKYEGSDNVAILNYGLEKEDYTAIEGREQVIYKPDKLSFWSGGTMSYQSIDTALTAAGPESDLNTRDRLTIYNNGSISSGYKHPTNAIRDTQLSKNDNSGEHFVYHCGLDILNNHLIRSNTFKCICKMPTTWEEEKDGEIKPKKVDETDYTAFNTIADLMRDAKGNKVIEKLYFPTTSGIDGGVKFVGLHTYLYDDILTFSEAVKGRLIEKHNGWFGFSNKSKIKSYMLFSSKGDPKDLKMERPIMYMNGGDFVDMYPGRELYSFVPLYNKYRDRMEKNWNYCITYPSSSTTDGFDDIIESSNSSLKTIYFDENTRADSGSMQLVMYSKARHGLKPGDRVNIYKSYTVTTDDDKTEDVTDLVIANVEVDEVVDDFIFTTFTQGVQISQNWVQLKSDDLISGFTIGTGDDKKNYHIANDGGKYFYDDDFTRYFIVNDKYVNIDPTAQNITYKKVVNDIECDYYVRIFSRLPNFRFVSGDTTHDFMIYNKPIVEGKVGDSLLETYQKPEYEFESHVSRLAFARNIYSDEIGEVVFTDDINIANIHDNLGRPLTDIYLTIVKNNAGYKEWYGYDGAYAPTASTVEFSHCFGKITCGFEMSDESTGDTYANNIKLITNIKGINTGYAVDTINNRDDEEVFVRLGLTPDEINFNTDVHYYGDLCCYDNYNAVEQSIQNIMHRFNTAQRESKLADKGDHFSTFVYDEIYRDDYDTGDEYVIKTYTQSDCNNKPEGYYYNPHYRIRIKSFGKLNTAMPQFLSIQSLVNNGDEIEITTQQYHFLTPGDKSMIYDMSTEKYYYLTTVRGKNDNSRVFTCKVTSENGNTSSDLDYDNVSNYKLFKIDNMAIPSYAHILRDGTCRYIWRDIINNGSMGGDKTIEEYPFTNGAFYINRHVDLFVRRQDPYDQYGLYNEDDIDVIGIETPIEDINNYHSEDEIKC